MTIDKQKINAIEGSIVKSFFKPYSRDSHKGDFGQLFIIAGSVGMTGAAALAGQSAIRSGAGLVTVGVPESLNDVLEVKLTEAMTLPLPEGPERSIGKMALEPALEYASKCDVVVMGPGISMAKETQDFVHSFVSQCDKPLLLDADALNALSKFPEILKTAPGPKIITPHPGEMARLLAISPEEVQHDRPGAAKTAAANFNCITILKGAKTLVCDGASLWVNPTGNPGMATAGSGDVLTGVIGGLLARGLKPIEAALAGVYIHGLAGDLAATKTGEISLIAGDIVEFLPQAIRGVLLSSF